MNMKNNIKVRKEGNKYIRSILVVAGTIVLGSCYTPDNNNNKVDPEVVKQYVPWAGYRYNPKISKKDWSVSQNRKKEIMMEITQLRADIKKLSLQKRGEKRWIQISPDTKIFTNSPKYIATEVKMPPIYRLLNRLADMQKNS